MVYVNKAASSPQKNAERQNHRYLSTAIGTCRFVTATAITVRCNLLDRNELRHTEMQSTRRNPPSLNPMVQSVGPQSSISVWVQCIGPQSPRGKGAMYWPAKSAFTCRYGATYWSARDWAHGAVNWSAEDLSTTWCSLLVRKRTLYHGAMNWPAGG